MKNLIATVLVLAVLFIGVTLLSTVYAADWREGKTGSIAMVMNSTTDNHLGLICEPAISQYTLLFREMQLADTEDDIPATITVDSNETFEISGWMMKDFAGRVFFTLEPDDAALVVDQFTKGLNLTLVVADQEYTIDLNGFTANSQKTIATCQ